MNSEFHFFSLQQKKGLRPGVKPSEALLNPDELVESRVSQPVSAIIRTAVTTLIEIAPRPAMLLFTSATAPALAYSGRFVPASET
jgi:hypothetical protein